MPAIVHAKSPSTPVSSVQQWEKYGFMTELRREQQYISQSTQPPSRVPQLWAFLNHGYLTAPSGFLFHEAQHEEASASCKSRTWDTELQSQTHIHQLAK